MTDGKPTAKKMKGTEWYLPAVSTLGGPKVLPGAVRQETRSKAVTEAKRLLACKVAPIGGKTRIG